MYIFFSLSMPLHSLCRGERARVRSVSNSMLLLHYIFWNINFNLESLYISFCKLVQVKLGVSLFLASPFFALNAEKFTNLKWKKAKQIDENEKKTSEKKKCEAKRTKENEDSVKESFTWHESCSNSNNDSDLTFGVCRIYIMTVSQTSCTRFFLSFFRAWAIVWSISISINDRKNLGWNAKIFTMNYVQKTKLNKINAASIRRRKKKYLGLKFDRMCNTNQMLKNFLWSFNSCADAPSQNCDWTVFCYSTVLCIFFLLFLHSYLDFDLVICMMEYKKV